MNETLKQIYKIVGSLDFVGNPTMLVSSFFSGVRDLVVAPSVAFMQSPTDPSRVGLGVAQGTLSLVSHSTSGFFGVLAKLSAAAGQSVATLSLDEDFRDWHRDKVVVETANLNREWKRRGVQSVGLMLTRPVIDILLGITGGISGIIISPVKGYQRNGKVGLAMGIAVGGVGLIAKPSVGVLDAFTHFTASIHDIAKSVNLLDRRLQPALRLRLPYTFGMMSILAPFDAAAARAADLLKRFPIKDSRRTSVAKSEKMIHVEVLPSTGTKTFAIATSARVVLIRVEKEQSGSLTTSLRWEVPFSYDAAISSRVDDHGHNGVALTLLKRVNGDIGGSDRNKSNDPLVSSPQLIGRSSDTLQSVRFITPEERMSSGTKSEEFGHGTGRGTEGDLLEWFTILAEYQYRRQLTRLHNVISCITKDFSAIVRDSSIGRASSTEGYTSFGMFFFERDSNTDAEKKFTQPINRFENLPWVGKDAFDVARGKSLSEQKLFLSTLRGEWDFNSELESSRREGGPMWLIKARARAAFVDNFTLTSSSSLRDEEEKLALPNFSKVTTNEDTTAKQTLSMIPNEKADINAPEISLRLSKFKSARLFEPDGDDADSQLSWPEVDSRGKIDLRTKVSPVICQNSVQLDTDGRQTPKKAIQSRVAAHLKVGSMSESSDQSIHSFRSAGTGPHVRSPNKIISVSHSMSSLDEGFNVTHGTDHSESLASLSIFKEGEDQQMANAERASARDDRSKRQRRRLREDRMDRMEALLERLLIFSSEQALQNQARFVENCDSSRLYQEISELRAAIEQTESARVSPQDINTLREDVASLREQLGLPPASAVHKATHPS